MRRAASLFFLPLLALTSPGWSATQPNDPRYADQAAIYNSIGLPQAWEEGTGRADVLVAVIDDGFDTAHADLSANIQNSFDVRANDSDASAELCQQGSSRSDEYHGTQVAGVVGASGNNAYGISGVNWQVGLIVIRVGCNSGSQDLFQGILKALEMGVRIINTSWGQYSQALLHAGLNDLLKQYDALLVVSAGNVHGNNDQLPMYPASLSSSHILAVAASDQQRRLTHWSNYGVTSVDVAAPGQDVLTTQLRRLGDEFVRASGTSFSAPMVSGAAALLRARYPDSSAQDIKAALLASVTPLPNTRGKLATDGVINVAQALDSMAAPAAVPVISAIQLQDEISGNGNGLIDSGERLQLRLKVTDVWGQQTVNQYRVRLISHHPLLSAESTARFLNLSRVNGQWQGETTFEIVAADLNTHQRFPMELQIDTGTQQISRYFELQAGPLLSGQWVSANLQRDAFDDLQRFHFDVPDNTAVVVFEMEHANTAAHRQPALAASQRDAPGVIMHEQGSVFNSKNPVPGFHYNIIPSPFGSLAGTVHAAVYHRLTRSTEDKGQADTPYRIRACAITEEQLDRRARVFAGQDLVVEPGQSVTLKGEVEPPQGDEVVRFWWSPVSSSAPPLASSTSLQTSFVAPQTGSIKYVLTATDGHCRHVSDSVTITVRDAADRTDGLSLNPSRIHVSLGSYVYINVLGSIKGVPAAQLQLLDAPSGVEYQNGYLSWDSAQPAGTHSLRFRASSSQTGGDYRNATFTLVVDQREESDSTGSGGCVIAKQGAFDPMLPLLAFISTLYLAMRRNGLDA